jgi:signal transduction histidine kinase
VSQPGLRDLSGLLALLAHDLRSPLAAILTNLNFLRSRIHDRAPDVEEALSDAILSSLMLGHFITNLDVLGRSLVDAPPAASAVALGPLVAESVSRLAPHARSVEVELELEPSSAAPTVCADTRWLARALDNVLANSIQYSGARSNVSILVQATESRGSVLVADRGPVVPADLRIWAMSFEGQAHAKQRFDVRYGRGLGLYCAAEAARIAGATMSVGEREGLATFELSAPLAASG